MASATAATIFNCEINTGERVAEAASRVTRPWRSALAPATTFSRLKTPWSTASRMPPPATATRPSRSAFSPTEIETTLTGRFRPRPPSNRKAREIQGDRMLTQRQEAMERIVDNRTPQIEAGKREHEELVCRIGANPELGPECPRERALATRKQNNPDASQRHGNILLDDIQTRVRRRPEVQRSRAALDKVGCGRSRP